MLHLNCTALSQSESSNFFKYNIHEKITQFWLAESSTEKCNSANYPSQFWIKIGWKTMGNFLSQWYYVKWWRKFSAETLKKVFSNEKWMASRKIFRHFLHANFSMFILFICCFALLCLFIWLLVLSWFVVCPSVSSFCIIFFLFLSRSFFILTNQCFSALYVPLAD